VIIIKLSHTSIINNITLIILPQFISSSIFKLLAENKIEIVFLNVFQQTLYIFIKNRHKEKLLNLLKEKYRARIENEITLIKINYKNREEKNKILLLLAKNPNLNKNIILMQLSNSNGSFYCAVNKDKKSIINKLISP